MPGYWSDQISATVILLLPLVPEDSLPLDPDDSLPPEPDDSPPEPLELQDALVLEELIELA